MSASAKVTPAPMELVGAPEALEEVDGKYVSSDGKPLHQRHGASARTMDFGALDLLDTGLEGLIGLPQGQPEATMRAEHCESEDSRETFQPYEGVDELTTSQAEWDFVVSLTTAPANYERLAVLDGRGGKTPRNFMTRQELEEQVANRNAELTSMGFPHMKLTLWEAVAARLYAGPMYVKYNGVLRSHSDKSKVAGTAFWTKQCQQLTKGNTYVCTIFAANSAAIKLSKLTPVRKIYRGLKPGSNMPEMFFGANSRGLRGGVEYGFLSTTDQKDVALDYATGMSTGTPGAGIMIEATMTMSARGANISSLSQYPTQAELLFPPLCGYDVHAVRLVPTPTGSDTMLWLECSLVIPNWLTLQQALERTPRFLERFELAPGAPLHVSRTAAVLAAAESLQDDKRRVALKFMCEPAQVEAELSGRRGLDPKYVVSVLALLTDAANPPLLCDGVEGIHVEAREDLAALLQREVRNRRPAGEGGKAASMPNYRYCLVLELADVNLSHALTHERFAGDWPLVRKIGLDLVRALAHLHKCGRIHADLKPLNVVRVGGSWQLIDLDVSCRIGAAFGEKVPSSGYCPPEMARVLRRATSLSGALDPKLLAEYSSASVAYDLWSLGCVLFHVCFGKSLFHTNHDDNVSAQDVRTLGEWGEATLNRFTYREAATLASAEAKAAIDLVRKLLAPSAADRLAHFQVGVEMASVADHSFFTGQSLEHALLAKISLQVEQSYALQLEMDSKLDQMLGMLNAQFTMLGALLHGVDKLAPKMIVFLPATTDGGGGGGRSRSALRLPAWVRSPKDWLNQRVRVYFVDPIRLTLAPTNGGAGYELVFPRAWVAKAMPYVKLGLTALKVACVAGRLAGFPVPNVGELIEAQLGALAELKYEAIGALSGLTNDPRLAAELLGGVDQRCDAMLAAAAGETIPSEGEPLKEPLKEPLQKSVEELDELLPAGWKKGCGLEMVVAQDGTTEWVLPQDKNDFAEKGNALLGARSEAVGAPADSVGPNGAGVPAGGVANDGVDGETAPLLPAAAGRGATADAQGVTLLFEQVQQEVQLLRSELKAHKSGGGLCPATCTVL